METKFTGTTSVPLMIAMLGARVSSVFFGGIKWIPESKQKDATSDSWGYGNAPTTEEEFFTRYEGLVSALLEAPNIMGFCYTQLYDVEQEVNGLYTYSREKKFDDYSRIIAARICSGAACFFFSL